MNESLLCTKGPVLGVPKNILRFDDSLRFHKTQHTVPLIHVAMICYGEKMQSKISKGKMHGDRSGGNEMLVPAEPHGMCFTPPAMNCDNLRQTLPTSEAP